MKDRTIYLISFFRDMVIWAVVAVVFRRLEILIVGVLITGFSHAARPKEAHSELLTNAANTYTGILEFFNSALRRQHALQEEAEEQHAKAGARPLEFFTCRLPFEGAWRCYNGGLTERTSHSWDITSQRYAYDFDRCDDQGTSYRGEGRELTDYYCFDQPVLACADGIVRELRQDIADFPLPNRGTDWRTPDLRGNYVVIEHAPSAFSVYAHLVKDSVCVAVGESVTAGQLIGKCGSSGSSTEPHLHFQVQTEQDFFTATGLPLRFTGARVKHPFGAEEEPETAALFCGMLVEAV
jgi:hypothetical protein